MVRLLLFGPLMAWLAACNVAGPGFRGAPVHLVTSGPHRFALRQAGPEVEAIRLDPAWMPDPARVATHAALVVSRRTGCGVEWVRGDAALLRMGLDCPARLPPTPPHPPPVVDCEVLDADPSDVGGFRYGLSLDCAAVAGAVSAFSKNTLEALAR